MLERLARDKHSSCLYYKLIMIVNYESSIVNKFGASPTDDARVVIYDRHMFIVQATGRKIKGVSDMTESQLNYYLSCC